MGSKTILESSRVRFIVQWLPAILGFIGTFSSLATQVGYVTTSLLAGFVGLLLWIVSNRIVGKTTPQPVVTPLRKVSEPTTPSPATQTPMKPTLHPVCDIGPYKVEAGEVRSILLDAKQGQRVRGHLEEVDGQPFDWYIADEKNMILLKKGERRKFKAIDEGYNDPAYTVSRKIPWKARWFLILDTYGKQYSRKVRVDFESIGSI